MKDFEILFTDNDRIHFSGKMSHVRQTPTTFEIDRDDGSTAIWPLANIYEITIKDHPAEAK